MPEMQHSVSGILCQAMPFMWQQRCHWSGVDEEAQVQEDGNLRGLRKIQEAYPSSCFRKEAGCCSGRVLRVPHRTQQESKKGQAAWLGLHRKNQKRLQRIFIFSGLHKLIMKIKVKETVKKKIKDRSEKHPEWQEQKIILAKKIVGELEKANTNLSKIIEILNDVYDNKD
jgi:hypothetical protein